jgi:mitochondrial fission protein ELM1
LIDFRTAGPGTLPRLFGGVEAILATEDSSTMLSEAVCARLPVVGVAPRKHDFKDEEREYRALLTNEGWCRSVSLATLTPATFLAALAEVRPLDENHLDRLASSLAERLPELFRNRS